MTICVMYTPFLGRKIHITHYEELHICSIKSITFYVLQFMNIVISIHIATTQFINKRV